MHEYERRYRVLEDWSDRIARRVRRWHRLLWVDHFDPIQFDVADLEKQNAYWRNNRRRAQTFLDFCREVAGGRVPSIEEIENVVCRVDGLETARFCLDDYLGQMKYFNARRRK